MPNYIILETVLLYFIEIALLYCTLLFNADPTKTTKSYIYLYFQNRKKKTNALFKPWFQVSSSLYGLGLNNNKKDLLDNSFHQSSGLKIEAHHFYLTNYFWQ